MVRHDIPRRPAWKSGKRKPGDPTPWHDPKWLVQKYHREGLSQRQIADEAGCSQLTIMKAMQKHGIPARAGGHAAVTVRAVGACTPGCPYWEECLDWEVEGPCPQP